MKYTDIDTEVPKAMTGSIGNSASFSLGAAQAQPDQQLTVPQILLFGARGASKASVFFSLTGVRIPGDPECNAWRGFELCTRPGTRYRVYGSLRFEDATRVDMHLFMEEITLPWLFTGYDIQPVIEKLRDRIDHSEYILNITVTRPGLAPLDIVDLPHVLPWDPKWQIQSTGVRTMIHRYLVEENNIIVAVTEVDKPDDASQIIATAKMYDPLGQRTVGVITNANWSTWFPQASANHITSYDKPKFELPCGWHVLNYHDKDFRSLSLPRGSDERVTNASYPTWAMSSQLKRGIESLRETLEQMSFERRNNQVQAITIATKRSLNDSLDRLDGLGPERPELQNMRSFLVNIACEFEKISTSAISTHYDNPFFRTGGENVKLRKQIWRHGRAFNHNMQAYGPLQTIDREYPVAEHPLRTSKSVLSLLEQGPCNIPKPQHVAFRDLCARLDAKIRTGSTGLDYGDTRLEDRVIELFMEYSASWRSLALKYISMVLCECKAFVECVFQYLFRSCWERAAEIMRDAYIDPFFEKSEALLENMLNEIIDPYEQGYAIPFEEDLENDLADKADAKRNHDTLSRGSSELSTMTAGVLTNSEAVPNHSKQPSEEEDTARKLPDPDGSPGARIIDSMEVFYERSRTTFTDNVVNLLVERRLVRLIWTLFTAEMVSELPEKQIRELVSEPPDVQKRRKELVQDIKAREGQLRYWRKYRPEKLRLFPLSIPQDLARSPAAASASETTPDEPKTREKQTSGESSSTGTASARSNTPIKDDKSKPDAVLAGLASEERSEGKETEAAGITAAG
ncbi:hypothetical protein NLG97_g4543 [Lecanicillium saksenae]|uniref:Uncharacterized protein n=1 Tax=Lecanicillium saksenae TaxID=468837 RepID=A0ACC1QV00_9HYPO|nr:hypothetical protein NLG97_g4543 [Lecanicillium saksenae]